jgi:hypothetical protein
MKEILAATDGLQIGTGTERLLTRTGEDDPTYRGIDLGLRQCISDRRANGAVDGVACVWSIDCDEQRITLPF